MCMGHACGCVLLRLSVMLVLVCAVRALRCPVVLCESTCVSCVYVCRVCVSRV